MPNIDSAKKRVRQDKVRRMRNRARRTRLRTSLRQLNEAIVAGNAEAVAEQWKETQSVLDRSARLGIIHRNMAARKKARLAQRIAQLG